MARLDSRLRQKHPSHWTSILGGKDETGREGQNCGVRAANVPPGEQLPADPNNRTIEQQAYRESWISSISFGATPATTIFPTWAKWSIISLPLSLQEVFAFSITDLNFAQLAYSRTVISSLAYQNSIPSSVHRQGMDSRLRRKHPSP